MEKEKKITIGLLVGGILDNFTVAVCRGAMKAAREAGIELIIIPGKYLDVDLVNKKEIMYEYQYNTMFSFAQKKNVDALVISADSIGCYTTRERVEEMLSQYAGIPCILIASQIENYVSVDYDNTSGIREALEYLIQRLHCRRIGMIGGPEDNTDARERKEAFISILEENGICFEDRLFVEGNLYRNPGKAYHTIIENNPDLEAVFCVNDDTAIGFYDALREYRLQPGKQIKVFGYDNIFLATKIKPALSSVQADAVHLGRHAVKMAIQMLEGEQVESHRLPTRFIRRDSFGYGNPNDQSEDEKRFRKGYIDEDFDDIFYRYQEMHDEEETLYIRNAFHSLMEKLTHLDMKSDIRNEALSAIDVFLELKALEYADMENFITYVEKIYHIMLEKYQETEEKLKLKEIFTIIYRKIIQAVDQHYGGIVEAQEQKNYEMKLFVRKTMDFEKGNDQSYMSLLDHLGWLDIQNAYVYVYEKPIMHLYQEPFQVPDKLYLKAVLRDGEAQSVLETEQQVMIQDLFHNGHVVSNGKASVLLPLFSNEMLYGVVMCDMTEKLFENGDFLVNQMSAAVKMIELLKANNAIQRQLEESLLTLRENNIALDTLSKSDVLTGIYNRRGFYDAAEAFLQKYHDSGKEIVVAYIDMNNLKIINDRYGHDEGDFSIKLIGEMLTQETADKGIVGRIGGDEFATISFFEEKSRNDYVNKIYTAFGKYNETSDKPYNVTVSVGICILHVGQEMTLKEALTRADERLYEEKQHRVKTVAK